MADIPVKFVNFSWQRLHPFGKKAVIAALAGAAASWLFLPGMFWLFLAAASAAAFFFRNPKRTPPRNERAILAPADGLVAVAEGGPSPKVAIVLNLWNVHIIRMPWSCRVTKVRKKKGEYLPANRPAASAANARTVVDTERNGEPLRLIMLSGFIARKIECLAKSGQKWAAAKRMGLIYLGSRVEVELPSSAELLARPGQTAVGGETILATITKRSK